MKRLAAVALVIVGLTLPICAQHGASHGGFSGHSAQGFHGGFSSSGTGRFASAPHYAGGRSFSMPRGGQRNGAPGSGARPPYNRSWRYRRPYVSPYALISPGYFPGSVGPGYLAYPDDTGSDDSSAPPSNAAQGFDASAPDQEPLPPYPNQSASNQAQPAPAPDSDDSLTLVFKDGRPQEQIRNYVLTRTVLYVGDAHHRAIPLDQLDVAATEKVNQDAGVDFHLPSTPR